MPLYRPLPTQPPHQPQPLRKRTTPGVVTQGAQATPNITLSLVSPSAFAALGATASPSILLSLAPVALKIAVATAAPSITLSLAPVALKIAVATASPSITLSLAPAAIWVASAQASPSITLSLAPVALKIAVATASPSITLSLGPVGLDIALATAAPSIRLTLSPSAAALAQATPSITLSLAPVGRLVGLVQATPSITLSLGPVGARAQPATATPSITLTLSPDAGAAVFTATASPSITLAFAAPVVTDSFNRADNASSLGTADSGQVWSALVGTWGISSNTAIRVSGAGTGYVVTESGIADAIIQAKLSPTDAAQTFLAGLIFRVQSTNNVWGFYIRPNLGLAILFKLVAGVLTTTDTVSYTRSAASVLKVICAGTTIDCYVNEVRVIHATGRTDFQTATQHGLYANAVPVATWNDFAVLQPGVASATVVAPRTAAPSILLALAASAQSIHTAMSYLVTNTSNQQGLREEAISYRGAP